MVILSITMRALPVKRLEFTQTLLSMVGPMSTEAGCLSYDITRDITDKGRFNLTALWKTREDLDHHIASQRFGVLLGMQTLLCAPPDIQVHTVSLSEGREAIYALRAARGRHGR